MVPKPRFGFFVFSGKRYPSLDAVQDGFKVAIILGVRSEWTMPRPAVIQFTAPGRIS
jgi:hypothetical protein